MGSLRRKGTSAPAGAATGDSTCDGFPSAGTSSACTSNSRGAGLILDQTGDRIGIPGLLEVVMGHAETQHAQAEHAAAVQLRKGQHREAGGWLKSPSQKGQLLDSSPRPPQENSPGAR